MMERFAAGMTLVCALCLAGCSFQGGRIYAVDDWQEARSQLGRTVIVHDFRRPGCTHSSETREPAIEELRTRLGQRQGLELVEASASLAPFGKEIPRPFSDTAVVEAARRENVKTVCVLVLDERTYCVRFAIAVPPVQLEGHVSYSLRVLDVASGKLLLEARRECIISGRSMPDFEKMYPAQFASDVTTVLDLVPPARPSSDALAWASAP